MSKKKTKITMPDPQDLRVAVLVPSHSEWKSGFGYSLANMVANFCNAKYEGGGKKEIEIINVGGSMLPEVRHRLVAEAFKWGATHALWLDSDMMFPRDTLQALLRHNLPVVGANYVRRTFPCIPTAHLPGDGGMLWTEPGDEGLVEVKHLGGGVKLVDMRVYDAIELPFFVFEPTENGVGLRGEDVYFCHKVRDAGIPIFVDQELSQHIGHIGEMVFTHSFGLTEREAARKKSIAENGDA